MRGRGVLAFIAVLLLLLPLGLLLGGFWEWMRPVPAHAPASMRFVPVQTAEQKRAVPTNLRSCGTSKDCDPPSVCLSYFSETGGACVVSDCMTDMQCPENHVCRARKVPDEAAWVRQCVLVGAQQEGHPCFVSGAEPGEACAPGLSCGGARYCGRPCQLDAPEGCPQGFVCRAGLDTPTCQPFCRGGDCPSGRACVGAGSDTASCMRVSGEDCQRAPCPAGQRCQVRYTPEPREWTAHMACVPP